MATGVGAVNVVPLTPVPDHVPGLPEPGCAPVTGAGTAVRFLVWPWHMLALEEVTARLLFCCTVTVMDDDPPG